MRFLTLNEILDLGFKSVGTNVLLSAVASFYNPGAIEIGSNVRIDDFCILSAGKNGIRIGNNVHLGAYCLLTGSGGVTMEDFSGLSSRVSIYTSNDDYSGETLTNPTVPDAFKNVSSAPVVLKKHVIVGCGAVILPGVEVGEGTAVGSLSLVNKSCEPMSIYIGSPAKKIKARKTGMLEMEKKYLEALK